MNRRTRLLLIDALAAAVLLMTFPVELYLVTTALARHRVTVFGSVLILLATATVLSLLAVLLDQRISRHRSSDEG